jgi:hypothetical protein
MMSGLFYGRLCNFIPYANTEYMALDLLNTVDIIALMESYLEKTRPPVHLREQIDINYRIDNQSIILIEVRPRYEEPDDKIELAYAKATFVKSTAKWKIYWMRVNLKWSIYDPEPEVRNLQEFLYLVDEDKFHCFKG